MQACVVLQATTSLSTTATSSTPSPRSLSASRTSDLRLGRKLTVYFFNCYAAQKIAGRYHGWPCRRDMAVAGCDQTSISTEKSGVASSCGAICSAISKGSLDVLAGAVLLVAGLAIPEQDRAQVLARVVAETTSACKDS
jgi:hypothetical protein